jgi:hypothetical protein
MSFRKAVLLDAVKKRSKSVDKDTSSKKEVESAKKMKDKGVALCNGVSFDLIAINKAARKSDVSAATHCLEELEKDMRAFAILYAEEQLVVPSS